MWTLGYNDAGAEFNMPDSFNGRKLRPLIPRPLPSANNPPCLSRINGADFFALNHHLTTGDQSKREFNTQPVVVSSRWNPTPEQLRTLEELYRRGTRTPSTEQIQHITAQLRRYGKIEGKNVFYWFQNHKARERQKRRRQMESAPDDHSRDNNNIDIFDRKDPGSNRTAYEVEQTKNWAVPTNCSTLAEGSVSIQTAAKATECRADGWIQLEGGELQQRRNYIVERNATWQKMMQLSYSNATCPPSITTLLLSEAEEAAISCSAAATPTASIPTTTLTTMDPKQQQHIKTPSSSSSSFSSSCLCIETGNGGGQGESQTLQLFPLRSGGDHNKGEEKENEISLAAANLAPNYQFFEFLPLKN